MELQEFIEKLTQALTYKFPTDRIKPGLTISYLGEDSGYYVSLIRWCPEKKVVSKKRGAYLAGMLKELAHDFLNKKEAEKNPLDYLEEAVDCFDSTPEPEFDLKRDHDENAYRSGPAVCSNDFCSDDDIPF